MPRTRRYAILTVDTEALPKRALADHVERLIWGRHPKGTAGVGEICAIGDEFGVKHVFFVDMCGAYGYREEMDEVVRRLAAAGQDVELHAHPEYLPDDFWLERGLEPRPFYMNQYADDSRAELVISHFRDRISRITRRPVLAFRAGSFRWNAGTIRALGSAGIPMSFNNSVSAQRAGQCLFSAPTNRPFVWSNGVLEIPATERRILPLIGRNEWWARLRYPESRFFRFRPWWGRLTFDLFSGAPDFAVFLLHSWSLLYWDENMLGTYVDDARLEGYRRLLRRLARDYEVITSAEALDLLAEGRLPLGPPIDLGLAELKRAAKP